MTKISIQQLKKNMENFVGQKCLLMEPHKHAGKMGTTDRVEIVKTLNKPGMVVKLDKGGECFVFDNKEIMFLI